MPNYSNVHAFLDNSELHPPKDFSLAGEGTFLNKNELGEIAWKPNYWQAPVVNAVNASLPPLSANAGDRYLLLNMGTTAICSTALGNVIVTGTVAIVSSVSTTVLEGTALGSTAAYQTIIVETTGYEVLQVPGVCLHPTWGDVSFNDIVEYFSHSKDGNVVNRWVATPPMEGYCCHSRTDGKQWYYDGSQWLKKEEGSGSGTYYESKSRSEMLALIANNGLQTGMRYWISDRSIFLTAISSHQLSLEGDHTRALKADGYIEIISGADGASIDALTVNGLPLIETPVPYTTSTDDTIAALEVAINARSLLSGYKAYLTGSRLVILPATDVGSACNGYALTATTTGMVMETASMANGVDIGAYWFRAQYDIQADFFSSLADDRGNVVQYNAGLLAYLQADPHEIFPWQNTNVANNTLINGALMACRATGLIVNNQISAGGKVAINGFKGAFFFGNKVENSTLYLDSCESNVSGNTLFNTVVGLSHSQFVNFNHNHCSNSFINAQGSSGPGMQENEIRSSELNLESAALIDHGCSYNRIDGKSALFFKQSAAHISHNHFSGVTVNALGFNGNFEENELLNTSLELQGMQADFTGNYIMDGQFSASNAIGPIKNNRAESSTVVLDNYSGIGFKDNQLQGSTFEASNASGQIDQNRVNKSLVVASESSADLYTLILEQDSEIQAHAFHGQSLNRVTLINNSKLISEGSSFTQDSIYLSDNTTLNVSNSNSPLYNVNVTTPNKEIRFLNPLINVNINEVISNYTAYVTLDSTGIIDFNSSDVNFSGVLITTNSGNLNGFTNLGFAPESFIIRPMNYTSITISEADSLIKLPVGMSEVTVSGNGENFILFKRAYSYSQVLLLDIYEF
ncbi:MAG: hypothetical protein SFW35_00930 [Chitinophagales bacterium]|nr:hypothetical protein [Chitinophagales bacterium]